MMPSPEIRVCLCFKVFAGAKRKVCGRVLVSYSLLEFMHLPTNPETRDISSTNIPTVM